MARLAVYVSLGLLAAIPISSEADSQYPECVLAGPDFPPPSHLSDSKLLASAVSDFEDLVMNKTVNLQSNDTAWSVSLFSKENKTVYEYYYTPPIDVGVKKVDKDSVFRIGSVSKMFSVWSFLIEAGDKYFNEPITKFVPELANVSFPCDDTQRNTVYDDINHVRWEDVTLGELASQAAGITRDGINFMPTP